MLLTFGTEPSNPKKAPPEAPLVRRHGCRKHIRYGIHEYDGADSLNRRSHGGTPVDRRDELLDEFERSEISSYRFFNIVLFAKLTSHRFSGFCRTGIGFCSQIATFRSYDKFCPPKLALQFCRAEDVFGRIGVEIVR